MSETMQIEIESAVLPPGAVVVARVEGRERISQLFDFEVHVVGKDAAALDLEELVGAEATLVFTRDGVELRRIFGMIASANDRHDTETAFVHYRLRFVPRAFRLTLVELCDIHLDLSVPDILRQKLTDLGFSEGIDFELRFQGSYPARDFVVQYQETDLAFVSRLTEHLGISFFFEHESGRDVLVFTDMNEGFRGLTVDGEEAARVPFRSRGERRDVYDLEETRRLIPALYAVQDYNYRTPQLVLSGSAKLSVGTGGVVEYGTHVKTPEEATRMAQIRSEERVAGRVVFNGASDVAALRAGARLGVEGHPRGDLELLVVEVEHHAALSALGHGAGEEGYHNRFQAVLASRPFRPARVTPKPRISGVVTGIIEGEGSGQYAEVDDQGRYRVRFLFDVTGPGGVRRSRPVRMAQPHAGAGYGMHFPLRPGVEVILTFVDGDPDRPIITATVPNPQTASPVAAGNAPRNVIRTGGGNEVNFDDTEGAERIKLSTPFMGTTLQLGTRNSPEDGVMIETLGHQSTMALQSANAFSGVSSAISLVKDFCLSRKITTVADSGVWSHLLGGVSSLPQLLAAGLDVTSAVLDGMEASLQKDEADKKKKSNDADAAAQAAEAQLARARTDTKEKLKALEDCYDTSALKDPDSELARKRKAYDDAVAQYEADVLEWRTVRQSPTDASQNATLTSLEAKIKDVDEPAMVAARDAYLAELAKCPPRLGTNPDAAHAFANAVADQDSKEASAHDAWVKSADAKADWNAQTALNETGDAALEIKKTKVIVELTRTTQGLFSHVWGLLTIALDLKEKLSQSRKKVETLATSLMTKSRMDSTSLLGTVEESARDWVKKATHTLGSSGQTVLFGDEELFMYSDRPILHGKTGVLVVTDGLLSLLSQDKAELAAKEKVFVTGTDVDIQGDGSLKLTAKPRPGSSGAGTFTAISKGAMTCKSTDENITLIAKHADKGITMSADAKILGKAKEIVMSASEKAQILAGTGGKWKLDIKDGEARLGGDTAHTLIDKSAARIQYDNSTFMKLDTAGANIKGKQIKVAGKIVDVNGNLLVKE